MPHIMFGQSVFFKVDLSNNGFRSSGVNFANNSGGEFFITEDSDSSYLTYSMVGTSYGASAMSLYNNLDRIIWDSRHFSYLEHIPSLSYDASVNNGQGNATTITTSSYPILVNGGKNSRNIPYIDEDLYTIKTFSVSQAPLFTLKCSAYPAIGSSIFLRYGNKSYRHLYPYSDTTGIYLREIVYVSDVAVPSITLSDIKYHVINTASNNISGVNHPVASHQSGTEVVSITPSRVRIGTGSASNGNPAGANKRIFDSDFNYLKKDNSGDVEFHLNAGFGMICGTDKPIWRGYSSAGNSYQTPPHADESDFQCILYHNRNGSVVYSESSNSSAQVNYRFAYEHNTNRPITESSARQAHLVTAMGTYQGNIINYDI